jgi:hypothetical protein
MSGKKQKTAQDRRYSKQISVPSNTDITLLRIVISLVGVVVFGYVILSLSLFGFPWDKRSPQPRLPKPEQYEQSGNQTAWFSLDVASTTLEVGESTQATVKLHANDVRVSGVDVYVAYDASKISIDSISDSQIFDSFSSTNESNQLRVFAANNFGSYEGYTGTDSIFTFEIEALAATSTTLQFVCQPNSYSESNINTLDFIDAIDCSELNVVEMILEQPEDEPDPTAEPTAEPDPTTTPTPTPTSTPTPTPTDRAGTGGGCEKPSSPNHFKAQTGSNPGQVWLGWAHSSRADYYTIAYGKNWLDFEYGQANIGYTDQFYVKGLPANEAYYFVVAAVNECGSSGWGTQSNGTVGMGAVTGKYAYTQGTPKPLITPPPTYTWSTPKPTTQKGFSMNDEDIDSFYDTLDTQPIATPTIAPTATPQPTEEPVTVFTPSSSDAEWWRPLLNNLPWIGLGLLLLLAVLLIIYARRKKAQFDDMELTLDDNQSHSIDIESKKEEVSVTEGVLDDK